jgi:hypothetical protein
VLQPPVAGAAASSNVPASASVGSSGQATTPARGGAADLISRRIDTMPLAAWTAGAAVLLPAAVWLLIGVTGSLARGEPRLRLPPFAK